MKRIYPEVPQKIGDIDMVKTLAALSKNGIIYRIIDLITEHLDVENCNCRFITKEKDISIGLIVLLYIALEIDIKIERAEHICALCQYSETCLFPVRN